jgi:hypothetical protein
MGGPGDLDGGTTPTDTDGDYITDMVFNRESFVALQVLFNAVRPATKSSADIFQRGKR